MYELTISATGRGRAFGLFLLIIAIPTSAHARPWRPSLVDKTRAAEMVAITEVTESGDHLMLRVKEVLKGVPPNSNEIQVTWGTPDSMESRRPNLSPGDKVLAWTISKNGANQLYAGAQGIQRLEGATKVSLPEALRWLVEYDKQTTTQAREATLSRMLDSTNEIAQNAALYIISGDNHRRTFRPATLMPKLVSLTKKPSVGAFAAKVMGDVADKDDIPTLIGLLSSSDSSVADAAHRALVIRTRHEIAVDVKATPENRSASITEWQLWWEKNKAKTSLRQ